MGVSERFIYVDHKDHDTLNNRRYNLRICSPKENQRNRLKRPGGTSKFKGVCRYVTPKGFLYFQSKISLPGMKTKHIGSFQTEEEAALAYNEMALKHFGEFALLNEL
jgi:hypothetical protein